MIGPSERICHASKSHPFWLTLAGQRSRLTVHIKNCIICWNYLYLSQKLEEITDTESREALLEAVAHGSTVAWRHLNLLGEYDFSAEKLRDSVGIRLPKLGGQKGNFFGPNPNSQTSMYRKD